IHLVQTASSAAGDPSTIDPSLVKPICTQAHVVLQALLPLLLAVNLTEPVDKALGMAVVEAGALLVLQTTPTSTLDKHQAQLVHAILNVLWGYHSNEASVFNEWDEDDTLTRTSVASGAGAPLDAKAKCFHDFWSEFDAPRGSSKQRRFSDLIFATCTHDERRRLEAYVASLDRSATPVI
ncbi:hypothetical protein DYB32_010816, partial [Aphanomyces invadans]